MNWRAAVAIAAGVGTAISVANGSLAIGLGVGAELAAAGAPEVSALSARRPGRTAVDELRGDCDAEPGAMRGERA